MSFCSKCGTKIEDGARFCPNCGAINEADNTTAYNTTANNTTANKAKQTFSNLANTADTTASYTAAQIDTGKGMSILSYFSILVLIPIFAVKDNPYVRYHANQGLILLICEAIYAVAETVLGSLLFTISWRLGYFFYNIFNLLYVAFGILAVLGIINAVSGKAKELPVIGKFRILK